MTLSSKLTEVYDCLYRIAVKAVIVQDNKVLLVRDDPTDAWGFPGGGVDYGESLEISLKRELAEEIGINENDEISVDMNTQSILIGHIKEGIPRCNIHYRVTIKEPFEIASNNTKLDIVESKWLPIEDIISCDFDDAAGSNEDIQKLITAMTV